MPRVSRKQAEENHKQVVAVAARLFREHGINGVSVPALMAEAGLTHGAFYGHFDSKEDLAAAACTHAMEEASAIHTGLLERHGGDQTAALQFVKRYTARTHRDQPGLGCPMAALADDASREEFKGGVRKAFVAGLDRMTEAMRQFLGKRGKPAPREEALASIAMLVGALVLSRATKGSPISDELLASARAALLRT